LNHLNDLRQHLLLHHCTFLTSLLLRQGTAELPNGDTYTGTYSEGKRDGVGTYSYKAGGAMYFGNFVADAKQGKGTMTYKDGSKYAGEWQANNRAGFGRYTYANGDVYIGLWKGGAKSGTGSYFSASVGCDLAGQWSAGKLGEGAWIYGDGSAYKGTFGEDGMPLGEGEMVFASGNKVKGSFGAVARDEEGNALDEQEASAGRFVVAQTPRGSVPIARAYGGDLSTTAVVDPATPNTKYVLSLPQACSPVETTYAMIKPDAVAAGKTEVIVDEILEAGFVVAEQSPLETLSAEEVASFYAEHEGKPFFEALCEFMTSGPVVKLILQRENAVLGWRALLGPTNTLSAQDEAPLSIRARFGTDGTRNACHGSDSAASAAREIDAMFPVQQTYAMIKPDVVAAMEGAPSEELWPNGGAETVARLMAVVAKAGFRVVAQEQSQLSEEEAKAFYAEHAEREFYGDLCMFMTSGPVIKLCLERRRAISEWRKLLGPTNYEAAKAKAPESIRALFGTDGRANACHGSDSVASAASEMEMMLPMQQTYAMIKPNAMAPTEDEEGHALEAAKGAILAMVAEAGFTILEQAEATLSAAEVDAFYAEHKETEFFEDLKAFMLSGPVYKMVLEKRGAVRAWRTLLGPTDSAAAKEEAPESIRARFGVDNTQNAGHGSDAAESAAREMQIMFPKPYPERIAAMKEKYPDNICLQVFDNVYYDALSDELKPRFLKCLASGVENPDSGMGCYACQPSDYDEFKPFFSKALAKYHKVGEDAQHVNDWNLEGVEGLPEDSNLDISKLGLPELSMRVRTGRNLKDFPLPGSMTQEDRVNMELKMMGAFEKLIAMPEYGGAYNSLTPDNASFIDDEAYQALVDAHIMFKNMDDDRYLTAAGIAAHWPHGRGCYVSEDKEFIIWVGEEDHLRIM